MARTSTAVALRYEAFWSNLLPLSNGRTGFSIRSPRRQASIEFWRLGFSFSYWLHDDLPDATIRFTLHRSDAETIYEALLRARVEIEHMFGAPLQWRREPFTRERRSALYEIAYCIPCPALRDLPSEHWPDLQNEMVDAMVQLEQAVVPQLQPWLNEDY